MTLDKIYYLSLGGILLMMNEDFDALVIVWLRITLCLEESTLTWA